MARISYVNNIDRNVAARMRIKRMLGVTRAARAAVNAALAVLHRMRAARAASRATWRRAARKRGSSVNGGVTRACVFMARGIIKRIRKRARKQNRVRT